MLSRYRYRTEPRVDLSRHSLAASLFIIILLSHSMMPAGPQRALLCGPQYVSLEDDLESHRWLQREAQ